MRTLLKELRLRLFTLRVLIAIHANKAMVAASKTFSKATLAPVQRMRKTAWLALSQTLSKALRVVVSLLSRFLLRFLFSFLFSFLLPLLVKAARASLIFLFQRCCELWRRYPRTLVGGATLALALFSLSLALPPPLAEPNLAAKDAEKLTQGSNQGINKIVEPRLSLLTQVSPKENPRQKQQALPSSSSPSSSPSPSPLPVRTEYRVLEHAIRSSLYETALGQGIALPLLRRFVDVMSYDVDFQREIWAGAKFRMLLSQRFRLAEGGAWQPLGEVVLEMAELYTGRQEYRYHRSGWDDAFYDEDGKPAKRLLRRTPMSGLRLTSRFGLRRHPILGYTRMHKGVDFAAPRGTPVLAAGDGVVRKRAYEKGYGRHIVLRHSDRLSTLYAHMRVFARGVREGSRVKQGQVVGYVGTSGVSTGPHLHYEIHRDGRAVNPRRVVLPKPKLLEEGKRGLFAEKIREDEAWLARGGSFEETSALAALRALGCGIWGGACDKERRAQR